MSKVILMFSLALLLGPIAASGQGKFSGLMFGDYYYNVARDSGIAAVKNTALSGPKDLQEFAFRRIYFTYDDEISPTFSTRFRLEADQSGNTSSGTIGVAVKDAYLKWKGIFGNNDFYFGISPTPDIDNAETVWGYRSLEKVITDLRGLESSRELGVALRGKLDDEGMFSYWAVIGNGNSNKPGISKYKRYYLNLEVRPVKALRIDLTGDYKSQPSVNDPTSTTAPPATVANGLLTGTALIGYNSPGSFNVGAQFVLQTLQNGYQQSAGSALTGRNTLGISAFGSVNLTDQAALVGRYDYFDPNTDGNSKGDSRNYFLGGLAWSPEKNVTITPNVQVETYESLPNRKTFDASVTGRVTFYYVFL